MYQLSDLVGLSGGLMLSMQGCEFEGDNSFSLLEINIPLLANFYVTKNFALKVGLQPGIIASAKSHSGNNTTTVTSSCQTIELSIPFGASYEYKDFVFEQTDRDSSRNAVISLILKDVRAERYSKNAEQISKNLCIKQKILQHFLPEYQCCYSEFQYSLQSDQQPP